MKNYRDNNSTIRHPMLNVIILIALAWTGIFFMSSPGWASSTKYGIMGQDEVKKMVAREAVRMRVPISLAMAVAQAESDFDPRVESHKGARGVMQIMPATAKDEYGIHQDQLWDPRINIRLGLHFLRRLLNRYKGRVDLALSYYNGGSAVGDLPNARIIPATKNYVIKVQKFQREYRKRLYLGKLTT
jgi:soluble lytic murein transglycosylase-like protein